MTDFGYGGQMRGREKRLRFFFFFFYEDDRRRTLPPSVSYFLEKNVFGRKTILRYKTVKLLLFRRCRLPVNRGRLIRRFFLL